MKNKLLKVFYGSFWSNCNIPWDFMVLAGTGIIQMCPILCFADCDNI